MKIIEAMRAIRAHNEKLADLRKKIQEHAADTDDLNPRYDSVEIQKGKVAEWLQSHKDTVKDIERLRLGIQKTNLQTLVKVSIGDNLIEKTIAGWIHRRRDLHKFEGSAWSALSDSHLSGNARRDEATKEVVAVNVRCYFDKDLRDKMVQELREEPHLIDAALEIANATTDIIFLS